MSILDPGIVEDTTKSVEKHFQLIADMRVAMRERGYRPNQIDEDIEKIKLLTNDVLEELLKPRPSGHLWMHTNKGDIHSFTYHENTWDLNFETLHIFSAIVMSGSSRDRINNGLYQCLFVK